MSFDRETNSWRASQCSEKGSDSLEEYNGTFVATASTLHFTYLYKDFKENDLL
jgi:hypothetical protein